MRRAYVFVAPFFAFFVCLMYIFPMYVNCCFGVCVFNIFFFLLKKKKTKNNERSVDGCCRFAFLFMLTWHNVSRKL